MCLDSAHYRPNYHTIWTALLCVCSIVSGGANWPISRSSNVYSCALLFQQYDVKKSGALIALIIKRMGKRIMRKRSKKKETTASHTSAHSFFFTFMLEYSLRIFLYKGRFSTSSIKVLNKWSVTNAIPNTKINIILRPILTKSSRKR